MACCRRTSPRSTNRVSRRLQALRGYESDLERYAFLRELQDTNETLFYRAAGREPRGVAADRLHADRGRRLSAVQPPASQAARAVPQHPPYAPDRSHPGAAALRSRRGDRGDRRRAHPGLGDQGAGGMGIPDRQARASTPVAAACIPRPRCRSCSTSVPTIPTAWPIRSISAGATSGSAASSTIDFIEAFVSAVVKRWPRVLLQWEDFAKNNATRCWSAIATGCWTFNDDIQGTAAVATGALLSAINVTGVPLTEQRVAACSAPAPPATASPA